MAIFRVTYSQKLRKLLKIQKHLEESIISGEKQVSRISRIKTYNLL